MILSNETINRFPVLRYKDIESDSKLQHDKPKWNPWLQLIQLFIDLNSFAKIPGAWNFYYSDCVMNHSIFPPANDRLSRIQNRPGNTTSDLHRTFIKIKDNNTNFLFFDFTGSPFATEILIYAKSLFAVNFAYFIRNFIRFKHFGGTMLDWSANKWLCRWFILRRQFHSQYSLSIDSITEQKPGLSEIFDKLLCN